MSDSQEVILSILEDIRYSLELIEKRFTSIQCMDDFLDDDSGLEKLDSISMRLIAIGEGFKSIDKRTQNNFLVEYKGIQWKEVKGIRDILSHHYFDMDAEIIYAVCETNINPLLKTVQQMIVDYTSSY